MLVFLMYLFAVVGVSCLLTAAIIKLKFLFPLTVLSKLIVAVSSFNVKFTKRFVTPSQTCMVALNVPYQKMAIGLYAQSTPKKATAALYSFQDILGSEIVENALTLLKVSKTSRISTQTRSNLSGVSGTDEETSEIVAASEEEINELTLKIHLNHIEGPVYSISFLPTTVPIRRSDSRYAQAFSDAHGLHEMIRAIVSI